MTDQIIERASFESAIGWIMVSVVDNAVTEVHFSNEEIIFQEPTGFLKNVVEQLQGYFRGEKVKFDFPLNPSGTDFQKKVWKELLKIPFGKTISYLEIARNLGDEKVIRAAASANGKNPIAIIIPCHRVIGKDGSLVGYAGGLHRKEWLLSHEKGVHAPTLFDNCIESEIKKV